MAKTYDKIDTYTLTSVAQGITFTSIPSTYTDLVLVLALISKTAGNDVRVRVGNGSIDSGANYSANYLTGNGSAASASRNSSATYIPFYRVVGTTTSPATLIVDLFNYSNTTTKKSMIVRNYSTASETGFGGGIWNSTSAINQIYIYEDGNTSPQQFDVGTVATLYGVKSA